MKVQGLQILNSGMNPVELKKNVKSSGAKAQGGDSVEISNVSKNREKDLSAQLVTKTEFSPRLDRVKEIKQQLAEGAFQSSDYLEMVAEKIVNSAAITDTVAMIDNDLSDNSPVRNESVARVQNKLGQKYYEEQAVMEEIAGSLIATLGFSRRV
jgi:hypothetical protein